MEGSRENLSGGSSGAKVPDADFGSTLVAGIARPLRDDAHDVVEAAELFCAVAAELSEEVGRNAVWGAAEAQPPHVRRALDRPGTPRGGGFVPSLAGTLAMDAGRRLVALVEQLADPREQAEVLHCISCAADGGLMQHSLDAAARARREQDRDEACGDYTDIDPDAVAADMIAVEQRTTVHRAARQLHQAQDIHDRLPRIWNRIARGDMAQWVGGIISTETMHVTEPEKAAEVERRILEVIDRSRGTGQWSGYHTRQLRMIISAVDPVATREREEGRRQTPSVRRTPLEESMERIEAKLEAVDAESVMAAVDELANRWAKNRNDLRDAEARRADALVQLITGIDKRPPPDPASGPDELVRVPIRPKVTVVADVGQPGVSGRVWVAGGATVRERLDGLLAQSGPTSLETVPVRCVDADPNLEAATALLDGLAERLARETTYRPSDGLRSAVVLRDGTCRHPGCTRKAETCDLDHVVLFNPVDPLGGGTTREDNIIALCRTHHRLKTHGNAAYRLHPDGRVEARIGDTCIGESWPEGLRGDMRDLLDCEYDLPDTAGYRTRWVQLAARAETLAAQIRDALGGLTAEGAGLPDELKQRLRYWRRRARDTARHRETEAAVQAKQAREAAETKTALQAVLEADGGDEPPF